MPEDTAGAYRCVTQAPEATRALGRAVGELLTVSAWIALTGDLGSGKTVFVQGLAEGVGVPRDYCVTSPSYTLVNEYPGRVTLYHVDLYRLEGAADAEEIGLFELNDTGGVVAVEWAERLEEDLPGDYLEVRLTIRGDDARAVAITAYGLEMRNLIRRLRKRSAP